MMWRGVIVSCPFTVFTAPGPIKKHADQYDQQVQKRPLSLDFPSSSPFLLLFCNVMLVNWQMPHSTACTIFDVLAYVAMSPSECTSSAQPHLTGVPHLCQ